MSEADTRATLLDLRIDRFESRWIAALHRQGLTGSSTSARACGHTALEAVNAIWESYEREPALNGVQPDPALQAKRSDSYFFLEHGTVMIRRGIGRSPWLVRWLPDEKTGRVWPEAAITSRDAAFPTDEGVAGVLRWVLRPPWAEKSAARPVAKRSRRFAKAPTDESPGWLTISEMPAELGTRPIGGPVLFILAVVAGLIWVLLFVRRRLAH